MKNKIMSALAMIILPAMGNAGVTHTGKEISVIQFSDDDRGCFFFQLKDVTEADPNVPNNPWFGVPRVQVTYKEILATLLTARTTGKLVTITTTDSVTGCGHAGVKHVQY